MKEHCELQPSTWCTPHSTSECCVPVWCRTADTRLIDSVLNDVMCIVAGCVCPTPTDYLSILAGIQPVELVDKEQLSPWHIAVC